LAFASLYWDLFPHSKFTPYIGAGLGLSSLEVGKFSEPGYSYKGFSKALFGYQLKAGAAYAIDPKSKIFAKGIELQMPMLPMIDLMTGSTLRSPAGQAKLGTELVFEIVYWLG